MLSRREVVLTGAAVLALQALPRWARAEESDALVLGGNPSQGGLIIGRAGPGSRAWLGDRPLRVNDGLFCFGFGRDDSKPVRVRVAHKDGRIETRDVTPAKREFPTQRIDGLPEQYVTPPKAVLDRIARDNRAIGEARSHDTGEIWFAEKFLWPVEGIVTGVYGSQRILNGEPRAPHYGMDIAAAEGTPLKAPVDGIVRLADDLYFSGNTMVLDHGHGVSTSYLHMSRMDVKKGERVSAGETIGLVGKTGRVTGPHLCWRLNWFHTRLDVSLLVPPRSKRA